MLMMPKTINKPMVITVEPEHKKYPRGFQTVTKQQIGYKNQHRKNHNTIKTYNEHHLKIENKSTNQVRNIHRTNNDQT